MCKRAPAKISTGITGKRSFGSCKRSYSEEETQGKEPRALYKWAHDEFNREKGIHPYET